MKNAFTLLVLIVAPTMTFGQGTIKIGNSESGLVQQRISPSGPTTPASSGMVQFFAALRGTALSSSLGWLAAWRFELSFSSLEAFLAANPGWKAYEPVAIGPLPGQFVGPTVTISNVIPRGSIEYFTIGWAGSFTNLDAAIRSGCAYIGQSAVLFSTTGDPTTTPPEIPTPMSASYTGMILSQFCLDGIFCGFTTQPINQTVVLGGTVTFCVGADACPPPAGYQWYFNGVSIPGACGTSLQIPNAQLTNAGTYWVVLSNAAWRGPLQGSMFVSSNATLTVVAEPPSITSSPRNQTAYEGSTVDFPASASGSAPLAYQWFFDTTNALSRGTNLVLQLSNVQPAQAGAYTIVVTNVAGALTSPPALLSVIPPVERRMVPGLSLPGQPGTLLNLENANALGPAPAWVSLGSAVLTNTHRWYFDVSEPLPSQRFYRAWQASGPSAMPTLGLYIVPAITLTGTIGHSVRLDYINQFGPTDAWVTLATVILTNTSQLYFDTSARAQPQRLYRLVPAP
jgi:hypothetical protein